MGNNFYNDLKEDINSIEGRVKILEMIVDKKTIEDIKEMLITLSYDFKAHMKEHDNNMGKKKSRLETFTNPISVGIIVGLIMLGGQILIKLIWG